jgi:hypothetical protein
VADKYAKDADTWLTYAQFTYARAQELFRSESPSLWFSGAILGHQALEMLLKAALIRKGHPGLIARITALEIEKRVVEKLTLKLKAKHWTFGSVGLLMLYIVLQLLAHLLTGHFVEVPKIFSN